MDLKGVKIDGRPRLARRRQSQDAPATNKRVARLPIIIAAIAPPSSLNRLRSSGRMEDWGVADSTRSTDMDEDISGVALASRVVE